MANATSQSDTRAKAPVLSGAAGIIALALAALPLLWGSGTRLLALLRYPYPHDGLEGTLLHEARLLWAGQPLYQPLERSRFVSAPYPPLHPLLLGLADQFAGPHVFWSGRLLSLAATLGVAALIVLIVRRAGGGWLAGLLGASLFLSAPPVLLWATRVKPDLTALLWTALGLWFAQRSLTLTSDEGRRTNDEGGSFRPSSFVLRPSSVIIALCFVLAFFTKQTDVMAPLGVGLALLIADLRAFYGAGERAGFIGRLPMGWRTLIYGLSYFALALGIWALLDLVTAGQYTAHVWGLHRGEWWSAVLLGKFVALLMPYLPAIVLALLVLIRAIRTGRALVPACYALVAPISLLGAGEVGANHNHLLECLLALALTTGIATSWMAELVRSTRTSREPTANSAKAVLLPSRSLWIVSGVILTLLATQIALAYRPQSWYTGELAPNDPPDRYIAFIRSTSGEVLADDVGLLYAAGRPLRYDDPSTMGPAAGSGVWDQRGLIEEINAHHFSAILLPVNLDRDSVDATGRWTPELLAAVRAHYKLAFRDTIFTYIPR
jgi:hypothetical protein